MPNAENHPAVPSLSEQEQIRRSKLQALFDADESPYRLTQFPVDTHSAEIKDHFEQYEGKTVSIAGRMMSRRTLFRYCRAHRCRTA